jgi:uncharacterized membrane protein
MALSLRALQRAVSAGAVTWSLALPLATLAASAAHPAPGVYLAALLVYLAGSIVCHQLPQRSFALWGSQMPVCARCSGIYAGAAATVIVLAVLGRRARAPESPLRTLAVGVLPSAATLVYEWSTGHAPANWIRCLAGVPIGAVVAWIVCRAGPEAVEGMR